MILKRATLNLAGIAFLAAISAAGCDSPVDPLERIVRTVHEHHVMEPHRGGWIAAVPVVFTNSTPLIIYLGNCVTQTGWRLEKRVDGQWEYENEPYQLACISPPLVIPPGVTMMDTAYISHYTGDEVAQLPFAHWPPDGGDYRLVFSPYSERGRIPLEARATNSFTLTLPESP